MKRINGINIDTFINVSLNVVTVRDRSRHQRSPPSMGHIFNLKWKDNKRISDYKINLLRVQIQNTYH